MSKEASLEDGASYVMVSSNRGNVAEHTPPNTLSHTLSALPFSARPLITF